MASETYPLALPEELKSEIRFVAAEVGLSMADLMRLALKAGIPVVREKLAPDPLKGLKPLTAEEAERLWGPDDEDDPHRKEFDALAAAMSKVPFGPPPEE